MAILPEGMSLPEKRFWPFSPRVGLACYLMKPTGRVSQASLTRPARGEWWCAVTDPCRPCWVTPHRQARHGGQGGTLSSREQDVRETPSRTYFRILRFVIPGWLRLLRFSVEIGTWSVGELRRYQDQSTKLFPLRFWLNTVEMALIVLADQFKLLT